jgi:hypothetical protein
VGISIRPGARGIPVRRDEEAKVTYHVRPGPRVDLSRSRGRATSGRFAQVVFWRLSHADQVMSPRRPSGQISASVTRLAALGSGTGQMGR